MWLSPWASTLVPNSRSPVLFVAVPGMGPFRTRQRRSTIYQTDRSGSISSLGRSFFSLLLVSRPLTSVNFLASQGGIVFVPALPLCIWLLDKYGLRVSIITVAVVGVLAG